MKKNTYCFVEYWFRQITIFFCCCKTLIVVRTLTYFFSVCFLDNYKNYGLSMTLVDFLFKGFKLLKLLTHNMFIILFQCYKNWVCRKNGYSWVNRLLWQTYQNVWQTLTIYYGKQARGYLVSTIYFYTWEEETNLKLIDLKVVKKRRVLTILTNH